MRGSQVLCHHERDIHAVRLGIWHVKNSRRLTDAIAHIPSSVRRRPAELLIRDHQSESTNSTKYISTNEELRFVQQQEIPTQGVIIDREIVPSRSDSYEYSYCMN